MRELHNWKFPYLLAGRGPNAEETHFNTLSYLAYTLNPEVVISEPHGPAYNTYFTQCDSF
jgi:hypothetical protein